MLIGVGTFLLKAELVANWSITFVLTSEGSLTLSLLISLAERVLILVQPRKNRIETGLKLSIDCLFAWIL